MFPRVTVVETRPVLSVVPVDLATVTVPGTTGAHVIAMFESGLPPMSVTCAVNVISCPGIPVELLPERRIIVLGGPATTWYL